MAEKANEKAKEPKYGRLLGDTFMVSYLILFGYTCITLIEAIRTPSPYIRHIMNVETTVSLVAGLVYGMFIEQYKKPDFDLKQIMPLRYLDWMITTPLILLGIILVYNQTRGLINWKTFLGIVVLNWGMLYSGYLGETGQADRWASLAIGFLFFAGVLCLLWTATVGKGQSMSVFWIFAVIWSLYGVAYALDEETKNISYNILDVISKALFGMVLWMYYGKVIAFEG